MKFIFSKIGLLFYCLKLIHHGRRDGSAVKTKHCSQLWVPASISDSSEPPVTPATGDQTYFSDLQVYVDSWEHTSTNTLTYVHIF